jgi:hypothetical protein
VDHRYNPDFSKYVRGQARWSTRHYKCLHEIVHRRQGEHTCSSCGRAATLQRLVESVLVDAATIKLEQVKTQHGSRYGYTCLCGVAATCACQDVPTNFAARLCDAMRAAQADSVSKADLLVDAMPDGDVAQYGTLRDAFLSQQLAKHRSVERVRRAAADERTSQGGQVVYFVASDDGKLKIGTSGNIEKRMADLQTSAATKLTLLLTIPGDTALEADLHRRFKHLREAGEWFEYTLELRYIVEGAAFYKGLGLTTA